MVDILLLVMLVVATLIAFARIRALAAVMLLPYLGWITFASTLNLAVWRANPGVL